MSEDLVARLRADSCQCEGVERGLSIRRCLPTDSLICGSCLRRMSADTIARLQRERDEAVAGLRMLAITNWNTRDADVVNRRVNAEAAARLRALEGTSGGKIGGADEVLEHLDGPSADRAD
jgi:hypothetical protein